MLVLARQCGLNVADSRVTKIGDCDLIQGALRQVQKR